MTILRFAAILVVILGLIVPSVALADATVTFEFVNNRGEGVNLSPNGCQRGNFHLPAGATAEVVCGPHGDTGQAAVQTRVASGDMVCWPHFYVQHGYANVSTFKDSSGGCQLHSLGGNHYRLVLTPGIGMFSVEVKNARTDTINVQTVGHCPGNNPSMPPRIGAGGSHTFNCLGEDAKGEAGISMRVGIANNEGTLLCSVHYSRGAVQHFNRNGNCAINGVSNMASLVTVR